MSLRIVIIEDEPAIARHLNYIIKDVELAADVKAILSGVKEALDWFKNNPNNFDIIFSDIQLSDGLAFEIFEAIKLNVPVIFVTAFNEYALNAFKANGIDYILKPFDEEAIKSALDKYKNLTGTNNKVTLSADILKLLQTNLPVTQYRQSLFVHYRDKLIPVNVSDVCFFYSKNEVVHAHLQHIQYIIDGTLEKLQQEINSAQFFRANRQFIVNRVAILEAHFYFNGRLLLKTNPEPPEQILISKARVPEFKEWMNR